ncbi:amidase [Piscinibacter sp.]|jgi:amidase|uniref:amidase n=1 Tax=Piscinibacter sp. TaxID=1903157 RepID=UPI002F3EA729
MTKDLHRWSAVRLLHALANRGLTALALANALIERTERLDGELRAWAWFDATAVRRAARTADRRRGGGRLHGLPLAVKDIIDTAGIPTAYGSTIHAGHVPHADAGCVSLARAAGAWVLGKTVSTEFANMTAGPTRNPHHAGHTPGGSSSGSAAAVAAGLAPLALGTQTAGSIIRPASYCGIVGYKPSPRRIPRTGVKANSDTLDEVGVLARSVDDVALLARVLSGQADSDLPGRRAFAPAIGVTLTSLASQASADMVAALAAGATRLSAAGAAVRDAAWPTAFDTLFDAQRVVQSFETARALAPEWQYRREQLSAALAAFLDDGRRIDGSVYADALAAAGRARAALETLFESFDVLLAPAATGAAPQGLSSTGDPLFSRPWQLLGCPCVSLPAARDALGLPLGLQVIARPGEDEQLLAAAAWIEARLEPIALTR